MSLSRPKSATSTLLTPDLPKYPFRNNAEHPLPHPVFAHWKSPAMSTTLLSPAHIDRIRSQFPSLQRVQGGRPVVYLDGPAGTQVPQVVADAVVKHLLHHNANHGGVFATSVENDQITDEAHRAAADFVGASNPDEIIFGGNMTTLTMHLSRAIGKTWKAGDEIIVTRLDHDANVRPWVLAAEDAGVKVNFVPVRTSDCTLDLEAFRNLLNPRTRLVAVGAASNSVGTVNPIAAMTEDAHRSGALVFVDAVHYGPHGLIDVAQWGCDFVACSAYKFFGPHVGILWGRRDLLEELTPYKLNPAPNSLPGKWMTGTQNFASIAGTLAAINYLANLGRMFKGSSALSRRQALSDAMDAITSHEQALIWRLIKGIESISALTLYGITDERRATERMPTISITSSRMRPEALCRELSQRGIFAWHGNYYAWELSHALGREPDGMIRLGCVHYNTLEEVDRTLAALADLH